MTYEEVKDAPLNMLVGYLASLYSDFDCTCNCKWESLYASGVESVNVKTAAQKNEEHCRQHGGPCDENYETCPQRLAYERVMKAVQKQMPQKPIEDGYVGIRSACPNCGESVAVGNFCKHCGQKIDRGAK